MTTNGTDMALTSPTSLSVDVLLEAVAALEAERDSLKMRVEAAAARLQTVERELGLLNQLLELRQGPEPQPPSRDSSDGPHAPASGPASLQPTTDVVAAVMQILEENGSPLPIRVIFEALKTQGVRLPGKGEMVNVIAAISRSDQIVRPARGVYALSVWGMADGQNDPPKRKGTRTRRHRRASARGSRS